MRANEYTQAQDVALLQELRAVPAAKLLALIAFLMIRQLVNRQAIVDKLIA